MISKDIQQNIIRFCQRMDQKGWVANHDGNISIKCAQDRFAVTPTARFKADLKEKDLIEVNTQGKVLSGQGKVFSEFTFHQFIFEHRPDVQTVVHAHPPYSTAVGCANQEMLTWAIPEAVISLGPGVPLVPLHLPNATEAFSELKKLLPHYDAILVAGNGVFAYGKTLEQAFLRLELVEHLAHILLHASKLGGPSLLTPAQVSELLKRREKAGLSLPKDPARPGWFPGP